MNKDKAKEEFDSLDRFRYSTADLKHLPIVNAILLELICARYIKSSFNPDEDLDYIVRELLSRTSVLTEKGKPNKYAAIAQNSLKHIAQLLDPNGQPVIVLETVVRYGDDGKPLTDD